MKNNFLVNLRKRAWSTAGARYNAARRLKLRATCSTLSLSLLSIFSIAASVYQGILSLNLTDSTSNHLTALSITFGVFILTITLLEWGAAHEIKADSLHRNAEKLTAYHIKLEQILESIENNENIEHPEIDKLRTEYESIKDLCPYNHQPCDYKLFRVEQRHAPEFQREEGTSSTCILSLWIVRIRWYLSSIGFFILIWSVLITFFWVYF